MSPAVVTSDFLAVGIKQTVLVVVYAVGCVGAETITVVVGVGGVSPGVFFDMPKWKFLNTSLL